MIAAGPPVVVFDYGSGNIRSVVRALTAAGCAVTVSDDLPTARSAAGLVVPGVGAFAACRAALREAGGDDLIRERYARGAAVLGICVGMQVMCEGSAEHADQRDSADVTGLGLLPGHLVRLTAPIVPHMGWNLIDPAPGSALFTDEPGQRYYFVHSYAVPWPPPAAADPPVADAHLRVTTADYGGRFIAAIESGPLAGTQFHPEKSGPAGVALLRRWRATL